MNVVVLKVLLIIIYMDDNLSSSSASASSSSIPDSGAESSLAEALPPRPPIHVPVIIPPIPQSFSDSETRLETVMDYLKVPLPTKMFLISPPASPPLGWMHSEEEAPVIAHRDICNIKNVLDAKTPREYYDAVFGNSKDQDQLLAQVVQKLSLSMQPNTSSGTSSKLLYIIHYYSFKLLIHIESETIIRDIILDENNMAIDDDSTNNEDSKPRPALLIEFRDDTDELPKILIEDTEKPRQALAIIAFINALQ